MLHIYTLMAKSIDIYQCEGRLFAKVNTLEKVLLLVLLGVFTAIATVAVEVVSFLICRAFVQRLGRELDAGGGSGP